MYAGDPNTPGLSAAKLSSKFGISVPQVRRILASLDVKKNPDAPKPSEDEKVVSDGHRILGNRLYGYRFGILNDATQAADALGWSVKKLRGVEKGHSELTLSDLQDMSEYMKISMSELTRNL